MIFTSWESCDDADNPTLVWKREAPWSPNPNAIVGKLPYRYYECLRQALVERADQIAYFEVPERLTVAVGHREYWKQEWADDFQTTITALIPYYVDHTYSLQQDATAMHQAWTEESLLAKLIPSGLDTRIEPTYFYTAEWVAQ